MYSLTSKVLVAILIACEISCECRADDEIMIDSIPREVLYDRVTGLATLITLPIDRKSFSSERSSFPDAIPVYSVSASGTRSLGIEYENADADPDQFAAMRYPGLVVLSTEGKWNIEYLVWSTDCGIIAPCE